MILAVDLAAKYSAACWLDEDGKIINQWDSWQRPERSFIDVITAPFKGLDARPWVMVIEDLPHKVPYMTTTKAVCRLQGRIIERMDRHRALQRILFVSPSKWKSAYQGLERGTRPDAVVTVAQDQFSYAAPYLVDRCLERGDRTIARKVATDYCAAYLIAQWALDNFNQYATFDVIGTERY